MRKLTTMISLAALLSAAACTTNMNPGSGEPTRQGPAVGPTSPTSTPGTSGGNVPMISSFAAADPVAIVANRAEYRTKYLGPSNPAPSGVVEANDPNTGQYQNPAIRANPQLTVNSTVSSPAIPTVANDVTGGVVAVPAGTTGAGVTVPAAVATPGTTPGSAFVPTPAAASVSVATPTAATVSSMASASTSSVTASNASVTQSASVSVPATTSRLRLVTPDSGTGTSGIRIARNTAGRVVVSNQ